MGLKDEFVARSYAMKLASTYRIRYIDVKTLTYYCSNKLLSRIHACVLGTGADVET
jgi:hypothetical protein